jgi:hypothetical protein
MLPCEVKSIGAGHRPAELHTRLVNLVSHFEVLPCYAGTSTLIELSSSVQGLHEAARSSFVRLAVCAASGTGRPAPWVS